VAYQGQKLKNGKKRKRKRQVENTKAINIDFFFFKKRT
jgi:hypothetical protein